MRTTLLDQLRAELLKLGDPRKAPQMQAYMKSEMPYHGVTLPQLRTLCKKLFADLEFENAPAWQKATLAVWRKAEFREERYGALILAGHRRAREFQNPSAMKMYEEMIVSGGWWDFVDDIAIHRMGPILTRHPGPMRKRMLLWSKSRNLWKRRASILCHVMQKEALDLALLYRCIEPSLGSEEFFLRKAIGWALRDVAWRQPAEVVRYVTRNKDRLSALSKREALKNVIKSGRIKKIP